MERPPGWGTALHPSCRHKYLTLQKQLCFPPWQAQEPTTSRKGEAEVNSLTPSAGDLWVKVVGREPASPGDSQHPTAAGTKPGALEYPFTVQAGACPVDERAALHMASPLRAMVFSTFPEIPINLSCLSCQPEQRRRLHFDSCSWKIQLSPSSSSPFRPPPTCLKKKERKDPAIPPCLGLPHP